MKQPQYTVLSDVCVDHRPAPVSGYTLHTRHVTRRDRAGNVEHATQYVARQSSRGCPNTRLYEW